MEETIFRQELQKRTTAIEDLLKQYLPAEEGYQKTVIEAMNYSLMAGGKRLRPMLMQETYRMLGGEDDIIEPPPRYPQRQLYRCPNPQGCGCQREGPHRSHPGFATGTEREEPECRRELSES